MEKVIALALLIVGGVTAAAIVMYSVISSNISTSQSAAEAHQEEGVRNRTSIEVIAAAARPGGTKIDAWVKNVGTAPIAAIEESNLFLIQPGTRYDALTYDNDGATSRTWFGDLKETGLPWNPGDTLHLTITVSGGDLIDGPKDYVLRMATPNGKTDDEIFGSYVMAPTPVPTPIPTPTPGPAGPVALLDSWVGDGTYAAQDLEFAPSSGSNRLVVIVVTAEKNASGPLDVDQVMLGDAPLTEIDQRVVGPSTDYHNILWMGYLAEAEIAGRTGDTITVTWSNAPNNPFGEPKVAAATYQFVDQSVPIADFSGATDLSSSTLQPGNVAAGEGDKVVYGALAASQFDVNPTHTAPDGYTEGIEMLGPVNDHSISVTDRDATTAGTENPLAAWTDITRLGMTAVVLNNE